MKKISSRQSNFLIKKSTAGNIKKPRYPGRAVKRIQFQVPATIPEFKPFKVEMWDGREVEIVQCLNPPLDPPSVLCFHKNTDETLNFMRILRDGIKGKPKNKTKTLYWIKRPKGRVPQIKRYFDFSKINDLSPAAALVLGAIYQRGRHASGEVPPAIDFPNWNPQAFQTFYEIGFFEIIGHAPAERVKEVYEEKQDNSYKVSKTITGKNADSLEEASDVISELLDYLAVTSELSNKLIPEINSAVSEAMINVARHAYPDEFLDSLSIICLKKWWMTARANRADNSLTIAVYDQGATIPGTLPKRDWYKEKFEILMKPFVSDFDYENRRRTIDHEFINYSMKEGKTQTGEARRGLGLPQMQELIDQCSDGTLSIISRNGLYKYSKGIGVHKRSIEIDLEGTLIEWKLALPKG